MRDKPMREIRPGEEERESGEIRNGKKHHGDKPRKKTQSVAELHSSKLPAQSLGTKHTDGALATRQQYGSNPMPRESKADWKTQTHI